MPRTVSPSQPLLRQATFKSTNRHVPWFSRTVDISRVLKAMRDAECRITRWIIGSTSDNDVEGWIIEHCLELWFVSQLRHNTGQFIDVLLKQLR